MLHPVILCSHIKHVLILSFRFPLHDFRQDHKGFGGNMSCADFWGPLSGWDDVVQMEKKVRGLHLLN